MTTCRGNLMCRWGKGDAAATDAAFARAAHVSTLSIRSPRQIVHYLETRAAWSAYHAATDLVTVTLSSQGVQILHRLMCERALNVAKDRLRLITEDVGGGFGPKFPIYPESTLIAWATRKLGRGLRWCASAASLRRPTATPATWSPAASLRSMATAGSSACASGPSPTSALMSRCSRPPSRPPGWPR